MDTAHLESIYSAIVLNTYNDPLMPEIESALLKACDDKRITSILPDVSGLCDCVKHAMDMDARETAVLNLYLRLHGFGSGYTDMERSIMQSACGCSNLPGGLMPVLLSAHLIQPHYEVWDLGAGNGLQGLLLQCAKKHKKTVLVEISAQMIGHGRLIGSSMGMAKDNISWLNEDILSTTFETADYIYMYRPFKPTVKGRELYGEISRRISMAGNAKYVLSVADCFKGCLMGYEVIYENEYMTCYKRA